MCSDCRKAFSLLGNLNRHMVTHTGEKHYVCSDCGKGFSQLGDLKTHMVTHTGEKPHVCSDCGKGFSLLSYLNAHMKTHTVKRPCTYSPHMMACKTLQPQVYSDFDNEVIPLHDVMANLKKDSTLDDGENCNPLGSQLDSDITDTGSEYSNCATCVEGFVFLQGMENHILAHQFCG